MAPMSQISAHSGHENTFAKSSVEQSFNPLEWTYIELIDKFASVCTVIAVCIAGYQIIQHLRHFNEPQVQLQVIRILFIIPVSCFLETAFTFILDLIQCESFTRFTQSQLGSPLCTLSISLPSIPSVIAMRHTSSTSS